MVLSAYIEADIADQLDWELRHPANRPMNHRPTDNAIKNTVILAQRYQQVDHATKTWPDLRQDIESLIHNNPKGTSREPTSLPRTNYRSSFTTIHMDQPQPLQPTTRQTNRKPLRPDLPTRHTHR